MKVAENLTGIISIYLTLNLEENISSLSHPTIKIFQVFEELSTEMKYEKKQKKFQVSVRKNQSCREFNGNHFYILHIEFGEKYF